MEIYIRLFLSALVPVGLTVIFTLLKRYKFYQKLPYMAEQALVGLFFGLAAVLATEHGVNIGTATVNARDASPLCAGFIFGAPAGIIAGIIGGVERWIAASWGAGMYSRLACSLSTVLAGLIAAGLRKWMFDDRHPNWGIGLFTGIVMEVLHMTILFLTHLEDAETAYTIVSVATIPMAFCNSIGVALSIVAVMILTKSPIKKKKGLQTISTYMQRWLLIMVVAAYLVTTLFVYTLQTKTAENEAEQLLQISVEDFKEEMELLTEEELSEFIYKRRLGSGGYVFLKLRDYVEEGKENTVSELGKAIFKDLTLGKLFKGEDLQGDVFIYVEEMTDYYVIGVLPKKQVYSTRDRMTYINSYMEIIVFALLFVLVYYFVKRLVTDNVLAVNESLGKITGGKLDETVNVRKTEEFSSLSDDINATVDSLKHYIDAEKERIERELQYAREIQKAALPTVFPKRIDFSVFASMNTAKEVGGDFYDFYLLGEDRVVFLVADVSGKGVPAALFMMEAKTMLKNLTESGLPVDEVFRKANNKLLETNTTGMFVTVWMGILELSTGHVTFCNAGHNMPLIAGKGEDFEYHRTRSNFVLAGMEDVPYRLQDLYLKPGDRIFLYTDGVTEATDPTNELYGDDRLLDCLNRSKALTPEKLAIAVKEDVDRFAGAREQFDDITIIVLEYSGNGETE